jgi:hypothetical protein
MSEEEGTNKRFWVDLNKVKGNPISGIRTNNKTT